MHAIADLTERNGLADGYIFENAVLNGSNGGGFYIFCNFMRHLMNGGCKSYKFVEKSFFVHEDHLYVQHNKIIIIKQLSFDN